MRAPIVGQKTPRIGDSEILQTLDRLNRLGSVLLIGAHPDDENNRTLAYLARGRHLRTGYLSLTRGEGGQNLIGSEQYEALGIIRTQELLAARRVDAGEQYFTRAFDFGYTKSEKEALAKCGRERVLADMVRVIRRFRPDIIVTCFSPTEKTDHGMHTASAFLAPVALEAAADPSQFPEQIREGLQPWRARRLLWNTFSFTRKQEEAEAAAGGRLRFDAGEYDPVLGKSYAEIAGESRSQHASQGMGAEERKGHVYQYLVPISGDPYSNVATADLFEGIDTTWNRISDAADLGRLLARARREFQPDHPEAILPLLLDAWKEMDRLRDPWIDVKRAELLHAIQLVAGLWLDANAERWSVVPGSSLTVALTALNRSNVPIAWERTEIRGVGTAHVDGARPLATNSLERASITLRIPGRAPYSQPYWLRQPRTADYYEVADESLIGLPEGPPALEATFYLRASGVLLPFRVPVDYRWIERVGGEQQRRVAIVPPVAVSFALSAVIFPDSKPRPVVVRVASTGDAAKGSVTLDLPAGFRATPATADFDLDREQQASITFHVEPPERASGGSVTAKATTTGGTTVTAGLVSIRYPHIPAQVFFPSAQSRIERFDARITSRNIGYVMGAGDEVPQALEQLGASIRLLTADDLLSGDLTRYDAIVTGIRALNVRDDLIAARRRLLDYVAAGGTLVVQYNTSGDPVTMADQGPRAGLLAPYPLTPATSSSAFRVSVEEAPVAFVHPELPILHQPNEITARDFEGWVQERGLYFMSQWDPRYTPVLSSQDPGEPPLLGGMLYARYGKGAYIFTGYSWFRQLPAGVPGAYRIFANLVSAK